MSDFLIYEQEGGVVTLTMNNPDKRNALSGTYQAPDFLAACDRISRDITVKAVILTGAGKAFSAGGDVMAMRDKRGVSAGIPVEIRGNYKSGDRKSVVKGKGVVVRFNHGGGRNI